ncbi:MAG TPA: YihY/virulence factor BrkB family protein [Verrucomicrobiae bacterium]|jgi:membrane protein|nr:YihY/virulence factor BrkB family protein [Verrucomicrobiae bacterium]
MQKPGVFQLIKDSFREFSRADCMNMAASLAYYTIFSLAPMLIVIIAVASLFLGQDAVTGSLFGEIRGLVGDDAAATIQTMIEHAYHPQASRIATAAGLATLVVGATGVFTQLQRCFNKIWEVKTKPRQAKAWLLMIRQRFLSLGMVLGISFLLLVSLAVSALLASFWHYMTQFMPEVFAAAIKFFEMAFALGITSLLFASMFKFLPDAKIPWRSSWVGGLATALFFEVGKNLIGLYLGKSHVASTYGAAGTIVVLMLWVYYSAVILFWGASFTKSYNARHGLSAAPKEFAVPRAEAA